MIPWIQVYANITTHDKTYALAERLKIDQFAAVGIMVSLWAWASVNATDGDVSRYSPTALAASCGWKKKPADFYGVLLDVGLLDTLPDGRVAIRNWERYASLLMDMEERQKKNTRERVKRHRDRKNADSNSVTSG